MQWLRLVLLCTAIGSGLQTVVAAAEDQPVPPVYVGPENEAEEQGEPWRPAVHCEGQNCLPPQDNPVQECEGGDCAPAPEILKVD